jgi:hypothetical protein
MADEATTTDARIRSREDLQAYLDHFNNKRYAQQIAYYAPDVVYKVGSLTLTSPQQIADFYADFHTYCREHVRMVHFAMSGDTVACTLPSHFEPFRDYIQNGLTFKSGDIIDFVSFIFYTLKDGKIWRIRVARYPGTAADLEG